MTIRENYEAGDYTISELKLAVWCCHCKMYLDSMVHVCISLDK